MTGENIETILNYNNAVCFPLKSVNMSKAKVKYDKYDQIYDQNNVNHT